MHNILNVTGYEFTTMPQPEMLEPILREQCHSHEVKGTVMLSQEGINLSMAGEEANMRAFVSWLKQYLNIPELELKESWSESIPFRKIRIRVKPEIIMMRVPGVDPREKTAPHLSPQAFKRWLDEGKDMLVLDTRNDYEINVGTFEQAQTLGIDNFREFPQAIEKLPEDSKDKPVVMFCTGGVRCEKASSLMLDEGFKEVYQLDGGIINYFKQTQGAYWDGECFVFDDRVAVKPDLSPTEKDYCLNCLTTINPDDKQSDYFLQNHYCPYCYHAEVG